MGDSEIVEFATQSDGSLLVSQYERRETTRKRLVRILHVSGSILTIISVFAILVQGMVSVWPATLGIGMALIGIALWLNAGSWARYERGSLVEEAKRGPESSEVSSGGEVAS